MKSFFGEFKAFAMRGNVIDLAVGVLIGTAFSAITTSLVQDILTPPIGLLLNGVSFANLKWALGPHATISYGLFFQAILNFVIIALVLFLLVRSINRLTAPKPQEEAPAAPPPDSPEVAVLKEIRDTLAKQK